MSRTVTSSSSIHDLTRPVTVDTTELPTYGPGTHIRIHVMVGPASASYSAASSINVCPQTANFKTVVTFNGCRPQLHGRLCSDMNFTGQSSNWFHTFGEV